MGKFYSSKPHNCQPKAIVGHPDTSSSAPVADDPRTDGFPNRFLAGVKLLAFAGLCSLDQ